MPAKSKRLRLSDLDLDPSYQLRAGLSDDNVERLRDAYLSGAVIPPIKVQKAGKRYRVVDGFHRVEALTQLGRKTVDAEVRDFTDKQAALAFGVKENLAHGLQLSRKELQQVARALYTPAERYKSTGAAQSAPYNLAALSRLLRVSRQTTRVWVLGKRSGSNASKTDFVAIRKRAVDLTEEGLKDAIKEHFGIDALGRKYEPVVSWARELSDPASPGTPILHISDWHYGERVNGEEIFHCNRFDPDIAVARLRRVAQKATSLLKNHLSHPDYEGMVVCLGGDLISGSIHDELAETDAMPPIAQAREAAKHIADMLRYLAGEFDNLSVYGVSGNHGRVTRRTRTKFTAHHNLDWLAYKMIEDWFTASGESDITFNFPNARDVTFTVSGHRIRLTHGDQFKGGDGHIGAIGPIFRGDLRKRVAASMLPTDNEQYDTLMLGHFHTLVMSPRVMANGSIKGYDEYALQNSFPFEKPQQSLFTVHPEHGVTWMMPIQCE